MIHGWDVSTAIIGHAVLDDAGKLTYQDYLDLRKVEGIYEKADAAQKWVKSQRVSRDTAVVHYIEQRLAGFSGGGSNAGTIMTLAAFNLLFSWFVHDEWRDPIVHIYPATVKATMATLGVVIPKGTKGEAAKELRLQLTQRLVEPGLPIIKKKKGQGKTQPYCWDICDAYCVAKTGYLKNAR